LIALARTRGWVVGYADEVWWSRLAQPHLHSWAAPDQDLRLQQREHDRADPEPAALCCYGLLRADNDAMLLRFVEGRPVSQVTQDYLAWVSEQLAQQGVKVLVLIWDNASWHRSQAVRAWLREHNQAARHAQQQGQPAVRIMPVWLPSKSPWLNNIEPKWMHGKKAIVEPERKLTADEVRQRVCSHFGCKCLEPLKQNKQG
jgi:transposase